MALFDSRSLSLDFRKVLQSWRRRKIIASQTQPEIAVNGMAQSKRNIAYTSSAQIFKLSETGASKKKNKKREYARWEDESCSFFRCRVLPVPPRILAARRAWADMQANKPNESSETTTTCVPTVRSYLRRQSYVCSEIRTPMYAERTRVPSLIVIGE